VVEEELKTLYCERDSLHPCLLLINTPSVSMTASYSRLLTRRKMEKMKARQREGEEHGNCVASFRLDAVSAPRDAFHPTSLPLHHIQAPFYFSQASPSAHIHTHTHTHALTDTFPPSHPPNPQKQSIQVFPNPPSTSMPWERQLQNASALLAGNIHVYTSDTYRTKGADMSRNIHSFLS
jgi:hypothetical protein